jgi:trehalose 6-phosphate phosphatase
VPPDRVDVDDVAGVPALLAPFAADPARSVVIVDFDGTLAPIVPEPPAAAPLPGAADVLARLVRCVGTVAVVSGRPVTFLREALPVEGLLLCGQYGVERFDGSTVTALPAAQAWVDPVRAAADEADASLPGLLVERKGVLAFALHWRQRPDLESAARELGRHLAATHGLRVEPGRRTLELRPPVGVDKGTTAAELAAGASAAVIIGDDRGDLAAFAAVRHLTEQGRLDRVLRVAVNSPEAPADLLAQADLVVDGPLGALGLLRQLADLLETEPGDAERRRPPTG